MIPLEMDAVVCHGPGDYRLQRLAVPEPGPGELLVEIEAVGICASDVKCFHGAPRFWGGPGVMAYCQAPVVAGHELVGRVAALGTGADARGLALGQRVVAEQIVPCGSCRYCLEGTYWLCREHDIFGFRRRTPGGMAQYMRVPAQALLHPISELLPAAHAAFAEPLACSLHAVERAGIRASDVVVVAGAGPIGLGMLAGARRRMPRLLISIDPDEDRLVVAAAVGADLTANPFRDDIAAMVASHTDGYGCDVYLDATGHPDGVLQGLQLLCKGGRFVEYGVFAAPASVDWTIIGDVKELDVRGAHLGGRCWPEAVDMLERHELPMGQVVTHQLALGDFAVGLEQVAAGRGSVKVTLVP